MAKKKNGKEKTREEKRNEEVEEGNNWGTETAEDYFDFERIWRGFNFGKTRLRAVRHF